MEREMTMIERAAIAILTKVPVGYGMTEAEAMGYARAVIEAMREPSAAVEFTVDRLFNFMPGAGDGKEYWQRMIDAALNEEPPSTPHQISIATSIVEMTNAALKEQEGRPVSLNDALFGDVSQETIEIMDRHFSARSTNEGEKGHGR